MNGEFVAEICAGALAAVTFALAPDAPMATRTMADGRTWTIRNADVYYNFGKGSRGLYRQMGGEKERTFAVRCVKN